MLSRLQRKAEALDEDCLRALGYPHDHGVRMELLNALQWEDSLLPGHARTSILETFREVHDRSIDLAIFIRITADKVSAAHAVQDRIRGLRRSLAALVVVLAARHHETK